MVNLSITQSRDMFSIAPSSPNGTVVSGPRWWRSFTDRAIPDAQVSAQMLLCLSREDKAAVDATVAQAAGAGGLPDPNSPQDYGFMYGRSFADPDGHIWEVMWMDPTAVAAGPEAFAAHDLTPA